MNREEKAMFTKNKLFETAIELFKLYGYDNVTVSQICKKAGVAKGTFYVHYQSKEDVIKESYYSDMTNYVIEKYHELIQDKKEISYKQKIVEFLFAELLFSEHVGFEMTCRAFVSNLLECVKKESHHYQRRVFTTELKELISQGITKKEFITEKTADEIFLYLESFVRGFMASWCFSNEEFNIKDCGKKYIEELVFRL